MPRGEKRDLHTILHYRLAILHRLQLYISQAVTQHLLRKVVSQISLVPQTGMVGVSMGNHRVVHGQPWVDIKPALRTAYTAVGKFKQWFFGHKKRLSIKLSL